MISKTSVKTMIVASLLFAFSTSLPAQQQSPPPAGAASESAQVEQLKAQLAEMKKEMDAMRQSSQSMSPQDRQMMEPHMGRMQEEWQHMHDMCGMMGGGNMMTH